MLCVTRRNSIENGPTVTISRGERRAVDGAVDERQHMRHGADVILVSVRQDQRLDLAALLFEIGEVGDDQVDAQLVGVGEHHAGVDDDGCLAVRHRHHVHAELAEPTEGHDLDGVRRHGWRCREIHPGPSTRPLRTSRTAAASGRPHDQSAT
jgi:hypothetical protein